MSDKLPAQLTELSPELVAQVDAVCLGFEEAWQQGKPPLVEDFLAGVDESTRAVLQAELLILDHEYRHGKLWYWTPASASVAKREGGPFSWTDLKELAEQGRMKCADMICRRGMSNWVAATEVFAFLSDQTGKLSGAVNGVKAGEPLTLPRADSTGATVVRGPKPPDRGWPKIAGYEVEGVLGRGAMGKVFKARQTQVGGRFVALKVIIAGMVAGAEELARFRLEAEALAHLNNPNIVQVYEVGEWFPGDATTPLPFFSMEFVEGGTLASRLYKSPQPPRDAAFLLAIIARAVHAAHQHGIIHRDLKPGNILLGSANPELCPPRGDVRANGEFRPAAELRPAAARQPNAHYMPLDTLNAKNIPLTALIPKISDFGLAKNLNAETDLTQTGRLLGTPAYMAPEQAVGKVREIGPATDIYALGAILYEMLTGRPPFTNAEDVQETTVPFILEQIRNEEPLPPGRLVHLPRDLETICLKCLEKDPAKRYRTAQGLADDIERFLANEPIKARSIGKIEHTWRWCRRNVLVAALTALLFTTAVVSFLGMAYLLLQAKKDRDTALRQKENADAVAEDAVRANKFDSGPIRMIGPDEFRAQGKMPQNGYLCKMDAGKTYVISLSSNEGKPHIFIWNSADKLLAEQIHFTRKAEFGGWDRLHFKPPADDTYRVMVAFRDAGVADYLLTIRQMGPNEKRFPFAPK